MRKRIRSLTLCMALGLLIAPPLAAQMWFFPDFSLPSSSGDPSTWIAATYGRGLNEVSGETNAIGAAIGKTSGRTTFMGAFGYITDDEGEYTAGASVGVDLNTGEGPRISAQVGLGWIDFDFFDEKVTFWRIPIGLAVKGSLGSEETAITPWLMPRLNVSFATGAGESETETDVGASGGVSITTAGGLGFHTALDALFADNDMILQLGLGIHYVLGRQN